MFNDFAEEALKDLTLKLSNHRYAIFFDNNLLVLGYRRNKTTWRSKSEAKRELLHTLMFSSVKISEDVHIRPFLGNTYDELYKKTAQYVETLMAEGRLKIERIGI